MARFTFPGHTAFVPISTEIRAVWSSFGQTIGLLRQAFQNGILVQENLDHYTYTGGVSHGVVLDISHPLGRIPYHVICDNGRVEFVQVLKKSSTQISLLFRLFTAYATSFTQRTSTDILYSPDAGFFREKDAVIVNGNPNTVVKVAGNSIYLSSFVTSGQQHTISLATEQVTLLFL